jgi:hypothetical protein
LFGVEQLAVSASADFVNDRGFQVDKDRAGNVLASTSLTSATSHSKRQTSEKKVLNESSPPPIVLSEGI